MKRVSHSTSAASSAKRSPAKGSRSIAISVPAGPIRPAIRRACPPPPKVQSIAVLPGCGSRSSISSPASTGTCVVVMSISVAKARCDLGDTTDDVLAVALVGGPIPDLDALTRAGHDHVFLEVRVVHQRRRAHQAVSGAELGLERGVEE